MLKRLKKFFGNLFYSSKCFNLGKYGERVACRFLKRKHYKIIDKNWRYKHAEIDIIALDDDILVFVEVRLRNKTALVRGIESISRNKKSAIKKACAEYLNKYISHITTYRFDVIDIEHDYVNNSDTIYHFENIKLF